MLVRKALLTDATNVSDLVNSLSGDGTLLKRSFAEVCKTSATSPSPSPMAVSSSAVRAPLLRAAPAKCAPSWSSPQPRARARADGSHGAH